MHKKIRNLICPGLLALSCLLAACAGGMPTQPGPSSQSSPAPVIRFSGASSVRSLSPGNLRDLAGGSKNQSGAQTGSGRPAENAPAPAAPGVGSADRAGMPYYYYGGEFSQYVPLMVEESVLAGNSAKDPAALFSQAIGPLLAQWDPAARLVEVRGNTRPDQKDPNSYEYVYVPGLSQDEPQRLLPDWVFRFASSPRKETLNVYISAKETRVYRVVWSEPEIAISRVKVSAGEAETIARKALADRSAEPGYPVYPESGSWPEANGTIVYDLPANLNWTVSLGQQGTQLVYYLYANYAEAVGKPGVAVIPSSDPSRPVPGIAVDQASGAEKTVGDDGDETASPSPEPTAEPTIEPSGTPEPSASPSKEPSPTPKPSATPSSKPSSTPLPPGCEKYLPPYVYLSASVSIDAVSGKVLWLNRPVRYQVNPEIYCRGSNGTATPAIPPTAGAD